MKKFLSIAIALFILVTTVPFNAFAQEVTEEIISEATLFIDTDNLVGKTKDDFIDMLILETPGLEIDRENVSVTELNGVLSENEKFEYSLNYSAQVNLYPLDGYRLSENKVELEEAIKVEGRKPIVNMDNNSQKPFTVVHYETPVYDEHITVNFMFRPTGPMNVVKTININFNTEINGKTPDDYLDFISVNTEGVKMGDEKFWATINYPQWPTSQRADIYETGKTYYSAIYIYPDEGYTFPAPVTVTVNGVETKAGDSVHIYNYDYETVTDTTDESCKYVKLLFEYQVTGPVEELSFFEKIIESVKDFFEKIIAFFSGIF